MTDVAREVDVLVATVREGLRGESDGHHNFCDSRSGRPCDCYARHDRGAHEALARLHSLLLRAEEERKELRASLAKIEEAAPPTPEEWHGLHEENERLRAAVRSETT